MVVIMIRMRSYEADSTTNKKPKMMPDFSLLLFDHSVYLSLRFVFWFISGVLSAIRFSKDQLLSLVFMLFIS